MHLAVDLRRAVPARTAIRDTLAADEQLSCIGVPGTPAGVADPGLSASVLIGGCVAFWRIGLRVSDARRGRCFLPWFPPPRRRFSMRLGSLVFL
jgi:hypothetical protein